MMRFARGALIVAAGGALAWATVGPAGRADPPARAARPAAPVRVELESVMIQRFRTYNTPGPAANSTESLMRICLRARAAAGAQPIEYAAVKLDSLSDDAGKSLLRGRQGGFFGVGRTRLDEPDRDGGTFSFDLPQADPPSAGARQLKLIAGSVDVRVASDLRQVKYVGLVGKVGRQTTHPMLREPAVRVERADHPNAFCVRLIGTKADSVVRVALSAGGRVLSAIQTQYEGSEKDVTWTLLYDSPPPASAILVLDVGGRLADVTVPFKFEDIELP